METTAKKTKVKTHVKGANGKQIALPDVTMGFDGVLTSTEPPQYGSSIISLDSGLPDVKQVVVAVGDNSIWKVGDIVHLNFLMFPHTSKTGKNGIGTEREIHPPEVVINGRKYLYVTNRHIMWRYDSPSQ